MKSCKPEVTQTFCFLIFMLMQVREAAWQAHLGHLRMVQSPIKCFSKKFEPRII